MPGSLDYDSLVDLHYAPLYRFALSLTRTESDACDLTQEAFFALASKGHQLQDASKAKSWLFTTLYRAFLQQNRSRTRFPHEELESAAAELPVVEPETIRSLSGLDVMALMARVDEQYRAPIALFYLEDYTYQEIGDVLDVPLGTVKSRISRGIGQLQQLLATQPVGAVSVRKGAA